jgi:transposase
LDDSNAEKIKNILRLKNKSGLELVDFNELTVTKNFSYLGEAVILELLKNLKMFSVFSASENQRSLISTGDAFVTLLSHRILCPGSKLGASRWSQESWLPHLLESTQDYTLQVQHLYRALPAIEEKKQDLENHLFSLIKNDPETFGQMTTVFYDMSSTYFEGENVVDAVYNQHSKDGRPDHLQLQLGVLVNERGFPFSWDLFNGNISENPTLKTQIKTLSERFGLKNILLVFDRGFISQTNFLAIEATGFSFITGLEKPELKTLLDLQDPTLKNFSCRTQ